MSKKLVCPHCKKDFDKKNIFKIQKNMEVLLEFYPDEENFPQVCEFCGKDFNANFVKGEVVLFKI